MSVYDFYYCTKEEEKLIEEIKEKCRVRKLEKQKEVTVKLIPIYEDARRREEERIAEMKRQKEENENMGREEFPHQIERFNKRRGLLMDEMNEVHKRYNDLNEEIYRIRCRSAELYKLIFNLCYAHRQRMVGGKCSICGL